MIARKWFACDHVVDPRPRGGGGVLTRPFRGVHLFLVLPDGRTAIVPVCEAVAAVVIPQPSIEQGFVVTCARCLAISEAHE